MVGPKKGTRAAVSAAVSVASAVANSSSFSSSTDRSSSKSVWPFMSSFTSPPPFLGSATAPVARPSPVDLFYGLVQHINIPGSPVKTRSHQEVPVGTTSETRHDDVLVL